VGKLELPWTSNSKVAKLADEFMLSMADSISPNKAMNGKETNL
jgi:hypothetical protein